MYGEEFEAGQSCIISKVQNIAAGLNRQLEDVSWGGRLGDKTLFPINILIDGETRTVTFSLEEIQDCPSGGIRPEKMSELKQAICG